MKSKLEIIIIILSCMIPIIAIIQDWELIRFELDLVVCDLYKVIMKTFPNYQPYQPDPAQNLLHGRLQDFPSK